MLFTSELFDKILSSNLDQTTLPWKLASGRNNEHTARYIDGMNLLFSKISVSDKQKSDLISNINSLNDGCFRGAISEMVSQFVLENLFDEVLKEPFIGVKTPDFYCKQMDGRYGLVEVTSLGKDYKSLREESLLLKLIEELKGVKSRYQIYVRGIPVCGIDGNFSGLAEKTKNFLDNLTSEDCKKEETYKIEADDSSFRFDVYERDEEDEIYMGWIGEVSDNRSIPLINEKLSKKVEKYLFPFILCLVVDFNELHDSHSLNQALHGYIEMLVDNSKAVSRGMRFDGSGFWGVRNSNIENNLRMQGVLFIRQRLQDEKLVLHVNFIENPHISCGLSSLGAQLPALERDQEGFEKSKTFSI